MGRREIAEEAPDATAEALEALKTRRAELNRLAAAPDADERNTLVDGEADARPMGFGKGPKPPPYNVQTAVDADTGLIVHHAVTNEPERHAPASSDGQGSQGSPLRRAPDGCGRRWLLERRGGGRLQGGGDHALRAGQPTTPVNPYGDGSMFDRSAFAYQPEADVCVCPAGRILARKRVMQRDALILYASSNCSGCSLKPRCTTAERRFVTRHQHEEALERMNARVKADPNSYN